MNKKTCRAFYRNPARNKKLLNEWAYLTCTRPTGLYAEDPPGNKLMGAGCVLFFRNSNFILKSSVFLRAKGFNL